MAFGKRNWMIRMKKLQSVSRYLMHFILVHRKVNCIKLGRKTWKNYLGATWCIAKNRRICWHTVLKLLIKYESIDKTFYLAFPKLEQAFSSHGSAILECHRVVIWLNIVKRGENSICIWHIELTSRDKQIS